MTASRADNYFVTTLLPRSNLECQYLIKFTDKKPPSVFADNLESGVKLGLVRAG